MRAFGSKRMVARSARVGLRVNAHHAEEMGEFAGQEITCKAAVAFEAKKPLELVDVQVAAPKAGRDREPPNPIC